MTQSEPATPVATPDETPREKAARRLLALAAIKKLIVAEEQKLRGEAAEAFTMAGQREPAVLPDGTPLGNVRVDRVKGGWQVTDPGALRAWVERNCPAVIVEKVTTVIAPDYLADMLKALDKGDAGVFVEMATGEVADVPPGVSYVPEGTKLVVTGDPTAPEAVRVALGPVAGALGLRELEA